MSYLELQINPNLDETELSIKLVEMFSENQGFLGKSLFQIKVCIAEIMNNIIEHTALANNESTYVTLKCSLVRQVLFVKVEHKAPAFEIKRGNMDNVEATSGRGWLIMESWLDQVTYEHRDGINTIVLVKSC